MEANEIVTYGNDILRQKAKNVPEFDQEIKELIPRMYEIMGEAHGVGLAGPQIGLDMRIFTYDIGEGPHALINPEMISSSGEEWGLEGCLSIPGLQGEVPRYERVVVTGINEEGKHVRIKAEGYLARVFQHEMDHLDGTMFVDKADPETLEILTPKKDEEERDNRI